MAREHDECDSQTINFRRRRADSIAGDRLPTSDGGGAMPVVPRNTTTGVGQIDLDEVIDAAEAARLLGVGREHVVKLLQRGTLPGKRLTATWVTTRQSVEAYRLNRRRRGRPRSQPE